MSPSLQTLGLLALCGCTVDRSDLTERVFPCTADDECAQGNGCQIVDVAGHGFCAPRTRACDGVVTDAGLCIETCTVDPADPSAGCPSGLQCLRADLLTDAGYCMRVDDLCTTDQDCAADERCLATVIDGYFAPFLARTEHLNRLTCLRTGCDTDGVACLDGQSCLPNSVTGMGDYCARSCAAGAPCPPGFSCYGTPGSGFEYCLPTGIGSDCVDDLGCLAGHCVDGTCLERSTPCEEGDRTHCLPDARIDGELNTWRCVEGACEWEPGFLQVCSLDGPSCAGDIECLETQDPNLPERICAQGCVTSGECGENAYCVGAPAGVCAFRAGESGLCLVDEGCRAGLRCDLACPTDQPDVGCCVLP